MTKTSRVVLLAVFGLACLMLLGCSTAQDASEPHSNALPAKTSDEKQGSVSATAYAEAMSAATRGAITSSYDPSGPPADAGGASRCFVCEVVSLDASQRSVSLDPVEFFLGEDASREARKDGKDANAVAYRAWGGSTGSLSAVEEGVLRDKADAPGGAVGTRRARACVMPQNKGYSSECPRCLT